jgi:hypothetical protein
VDGVAALALLAGGVVVAVGLKGTNCSNDATLWLNDLVNCGKIVTKKDTIPGCLPWMQNRCKMYKADDAFIFFGLLATVAALALSFKMKNGGVKGSYV